MHELRSDGGLIRYYCTAGNGMESFLKDEVKRKLAAKEVCQLPGKVVFSSSAEISRVTDLKAAERLFLLLKQGSPVQLSIHTSPGKAASLLQSRVLGDSCQWTNAAVTWSRLQGELAGRRTAGHTTSSALEVRKRRREGEERGCEDPHIDRRGKSCEVQMLEKKRKMDDEGKEAEKETSHEKEGTKVFEEGRMTSKGLRSCRENGRKETDSSTSGLDHNVGGSSKMEAAVKSVEQGGDETLLQPSSTKPATLSFRISCKCTGSLSRCFSSQDVSKVLGAGLNRLLGWKADLKNPQLEVNVSLSNDHCLLGFPLTRLPLANRSYMKTTGLRSTVAWAMASLAQIQPGSCVVDPMCGVGTVLIEAAQEHKDVHFLGVDIDDGQLQKANENVEFAALGDRIHLLKASSLTLPLPSAAVDAVVCDLPFGRKFGTKTNMAAKLPLILAEMERVLCVGGTLVLLLSPQLSCVLKKLLVQKDSGPTPNQETKPETRIQECPSPSPSPSPASTKQQTSQSQQGIRSPPTQDTPPPPPSSLKHQATLRVSLGAIDGLLHKYIKMDPQL